MAARELIVDFSEYDLNHVIADLETIRRYNRQRFEMEQLTAIVYQDPIRHACVGYKDLTMDEFWVRGHMPGTPLMPGVVMCEAAAQLCSYYSQRYDLMGAHALGFGGMDKIRFREPVRPGSRLVIACELVKVRRNMLIASRFQGFVNQSLVVEGEIKGIPLPTELLSPGPVASGQG